jgi:hypothetical protein
VAQFEQALGFRVAADDGAPLPQRLFLGDHERADALEARAPEGRQAGVRAGLVERRLRRFGEARRGGFAPGQTAPRPRTNPAMASWTSVP